MSDVFERFSRDTEAHSAVMVAVEFLWHAFILAKSEHRIDGPCACDRATQATSFHINSARTMFSVFFVASGIAKIGQWRVVETSASLNPCSLSQNTEWALCSCANMIIILRWSFSSILIKYAFRTHEMMQNLISSTAIWSSRFALPSSTLFVDGDTHTNLSLFFSLSRKQRSTSRCGTIKMLALFVSYSR